MTCPRCGRELNTSVCPYCSTTQVNNTVQQPVMVNSNVVPANTTSVVEQKKEEVKDDNKVGFFLKYVIIMVILILFTIIVTYLITKNTMARKNVDVNKEVYLNGYMYRMDKSLNTDILDNRLVITDNSKNYRLIISPSNIAFDMYKKNLQYIKNLYIQGGYNIKDPKSKTFKGVEYLTMEISKDNTNELLCITRGNSDKTSYVVIIENDSNQINYSVLEDISKVIKNIGYESISNRKIHAEDRLVNSQKVLIK